MSEWPLFKSALSLSWGTSSEIDVLCATDALYAEIARTFGSTAGVLTVP